MPLRTFLLPIVLGAVLGLALVAAWLAPAWLEAERFRPQIAAALADTLGHSVEVDGRLSVSLLPRPVVSVRGVRLTGAPSALLEMGAVEATLDPAALLGGEAVVTRLVLDRPVLNGARLAEDAAGWARAASAARGPGSVLVRDAVVVRRDEDRTPLFAGLQAEIEAAAIGAPYRVKGELRWREVPLGFDGSLGLPTATATPFTLVLRVRDAKAEAKLSGHIGGDGWHGKLALSGNDANGLLSRLDAGFVLPAAAGKAEFALQANAQYAVDILTLDGAEGRVGDSRGTGALTLALGETPRGSLTLSFASLDLDDWLAGAPRPAPAATWMAPLRDLPVRLDVSADALVVRKSVLRQARLDAELTGGVARIAQLSALLPGNSMAIALGEVDLSGAAPTADVTFEATSDNLRAVLTWLGLPVDKVPADRLRVLAASGRLAGSAKEWRLSNLDLRVDTAHVTGALTVRPGERLAIGVNLAAPALNLDAYVRRGESMVDLAALRGVAGQFDANVRASVGQFTVNGVALRDVVVDGTLVDGDVTLRQASTSDLAGAALRLDGGIGGLARGALELRELGFEIGAAQPDKLLRLLDVTLPFPAERLGRIAARGRVDGDGRMLAFELRGSAAGGDIGVGGSVADPLAAGRWDVQLDASHAALAALIQIVAPDYKPAAPLGAFRLRTALAGTAEEMAASGLHAELGPVTLDGLAYVSLAGKPVVTASLTANPIDLGPFLPAKPALAGVRGWSRDVLELGWLRGWDGTLALEAPSLSLDRQRLERPQLRLAVQDGVATLEQLHGLLGDGRLTAQGRLSADGAGELQAELIDARLAAPLLRLGGLEAGGGRINAGLRLNTEGRSPFEMMSRLAGSARLEMRDGALAGFSLGEVSQKLAKAKRASEVPALVQAGMSQGRTPFSRLSGRFSINAGVVGTENLALEAEGGAATGVVTASLPAETVDARLVFRLTDQPQAPGFVMALDGSLAQPRRSFDPADLERWVAHRATDKPAEPPPPSDGQPSAGLLEQVIDAVSR